MVDVKRNKGLACETAYGGRDGVVVVGGGDVGKASTQRLKSSGSRWAWGWVDVMVVLLQSVR